MEESWWEKPVCYLCDYWWLGLLLLVATLTAYFTRGYWLPEQPEPIVVTPTVPLPTATALPSPVLTETVVLGTGDVQVTLRWVGTNDLDLHVTDPAGETIYFGNRSSGSDGQLDVDSNAGCSRNITSNPVKISFGRLAKPPMVFIKFMLIILPNAPRPPLPLLTCVYW